MTRRFWLLAISADLFRDPAPPAVLSPPAIEPPSPKPFPELRFNAKPKPLPPGAQTADWPCFLGPEHNAVSNETKLLRPFPKGGPKLVWEMRKGTGYSSPVVAGEYLVYFHRTGNSERVECLHPESGSRYWDYAYETNFDDRYGYNNGPRASPVLDGDRAYTYGAEGKLHCFRLKTGQVLWKRDLAAEFKVPQDFFGTATTPLIERDLLVINVGAPKGPTVAAFHKLTGKMVWGAGEEWGPSYASPVPATIFDKRFLFVFAGGESQPPTGGLMAIEAASGALQFSVPWRSKSYESVNAASPLIVGNQIFVSASYKTGGTLIEMMPNGKPRTVWTSQEIGTHFNTAVHRDGYLYAFDGRNEPDASLVCVELKTGKVAWRTSPEWEEVIKVDGVERKQTLSTFRGTLLSVDGCFLCLGEMGHLLWLDLTPRGCREISRTWLFAARETWSLPVLSRGLLYVSQHTRDVLNRTSPRLLCYDLRSNA